MSKRTDDKRPLPPDVLADALQDRIHTDVELIRDRPLPLRSMFSELGNTKILTDIRVHPTEDGFDVRTAIYRNDKLACTMHTLAKHNVNDVAEKQHASWIQNIQSKQP